MTCSGPKCDRAPIALGLCAAHYRQHQRRGVLRPLRTGPARTVVSLRVSSVAADAVRTDYDGAVAALERWATT